jgi:hypothetical protein
MRQHPMMTDKQSDFGPSENRQPRVAARSASLATRRLEVTFHGRNG